MRLSEALVLQFPVVIGDVSEGANLVSLDCLSALGFTIGTTNANTFRSNAETLQRPSAYTFTSDIKVSPAFVISSGVTWSAECVLNAAKSVWYCDAANLNA
jgi:hypothetical protein